MCLCLVANVCVSVFVRVQCACICSFVLRLLHACVFTKPSHSLLSLNLHFSSPWLLVPLLLLLLVLLQMLLAMLLVKLPLLPHFSA